jgi:hypothetical protein
MTIHVGTGNYPSPYACVNAASPEGRGTHVARRTHTYPRGHCWGTAPSVNWSKHSVQLHMWAPPTPDTGVLPSRRCVCPRLQRRARAPVRLRHRVLSSVGIGDAQQGSCTPSLVPPATVPHNLVASVSSSESRTRPLVRRWDSGLAGSIGLLVVGGGLLLLRAQRRQQAAAGAVATRRRVQPGGGGGAALTWGDGSGEAEEEEEDEQWGPSSSRPRSGSGAAASTWGRPSKGGTLYDESQWLNFVKQTVEDAEDLYFSRMRGGAKGLLGAAAVADTSALSEGDDDAALMLGSNAADGRGRDDVPLPSPPSSSPGSTGWVRRLAEQQTGAARDARAARRAAWFTSVRSTVWAPTELAAAVHAATLATATSRGRILDSGEIGDAAMGTALAQLCEAHPLGGILGVGIDADVFASAAGGAVLKCSLPFPGMRNGAPVGPGAARARAEACILQAMPPHPGVVQLLTAYIHRGRNESILLLADAGTPCQSVREEGRLTRRQVRRIAARLLDALAHCHANGVIHRDVKPANVLLADAQACDAVLVDFGVAIGPGLQDEDVYAVATGAGTLGYTAPELLLLPELAPTSAGDVWAAGATLYELATGEPLIPDRVALPSANAASAPLRVRWTTDADVAAVMSGLFADWALSPDDIQAWRRLSGGEDAPGRGGVPLPRPAPQQATLRAHMRAKLGGQQPGEFGDVLAAMLAKEPVDRPSAAEARDLVLRTL